MIDLKKIEKSAGDAKWFVIPGSYFKGAAKLKLVPAGKKKLAFIRKTETKFRKGVPYEHLDSDIRVKRSERVIFECVKDWEGFSEKLDRINWDVFINGLGGVKIESVDEDGDEKTLSGWLMDIILDPKNFFENDMGNLVNTSLTGKTDIVSGEMKPKSGEIVRIGEGVKV